MAKERNKYDLRHKSNIQKFNKKIDEIYTKAIQEVVSIRNGIKGDKTTDKPFSFNDFPMTRKRILSLMRGLNSQIEYTVVNGIKMEWALANAKNDALIGRRFGWSDNKAISEGYARQFYKNNDKARDVFIERKEGGMNLSDRVWKYTEQFKEEIEMGLDIGIRDGLSADELSRMLRKYLKDPNQLFRRVRDEHGHLHLSKRAKAYHPGQGVYRSSYKNARRLAATETNTAYRTADYLRWQEMDFVVGIDIHLSNNHTLNGKPFYDICDELQGKYPKDFKFTGWHPHCRCFVTPILKTDEEMAEDDRRIMRGEKPSEESVNSVKDVPKVFKDWMKKNGERVKNLSSVPYFIRDNVKYVPQSLLEEINTNSAGKKDDYIASLRDSLLKVKDPNHITEIEVKNIIMKFAEDNPDLFLGGLKKVRVVKDDSYLMQNAREYFKATGKYAKKNGNVLYLSKSKFIFEGGVVVSPFENFRGALKAIATGKKMSFQEEYAVESLWHEIRHAAAFGWGDLREKNEINASFMETINQFTARHSYGYLLKQLGGKPIHSQAIISNGYGYREYIINFQRVLKYFNISQMEAHLYFKDKIIQTPYENIYDEVVTFIQEKGKLNRTMSEELARNIIKENPKSLEVALSNLKGD